MKSHSDEIRWFLALFALLSAITESFGQSYIPTEKPRLLQVEFSHGVISVDASQETGRRASEQSTNVVEQSHFDLTTRLQLSLRGYVYHPLLLSFSASAQDGKISEKWSEDAPSAATPSDGKFDIRSRAYSAGLHILGGKPYAVSVGAYQAVVRRGYDFFTKATVEGIGYSIGTGYMAGKVPFHVEFAERREKIRDGAWPGHRIDTVLSLTADNSRSKDSHSKLKYRRNQFEIEAEDRETRRGTTETITFSDLEKFKDGNIVLRSRINHHRIEDESYDRRRLTVRESLRVNHAWNLNSALTYGYHGVRSNGSRSGTHDVVAVLAHRLYASLRSSVALEAGFRDLGDILSSSGTANYGLRWTENYTKRLNTWGRLMLTFALGVNRSRHNSPAVGSFVSEQTITLKDGNVVFLAEPNIDRSSIVVSDSAGIIYYAEMLDYTVVQQGVSTEIRRVPGGTIPDGGAVLVEYAAEGQPSGTYGSTTTQMGSHLDLHKQRVGLYANYYNSRNSGVTSLIREEVTDRTVGMTISLGHVQASAQYQEYDSNISPFRATRLDQTVSLTVAGAPLLFDLHQSWTEYQNTGETREHYSCVGRYGKRISSRLTWRAEGGVHAERGSDVDLRRQVARSGLAFRMGRLAVDVRYEFQDSDNHGESSQRHSVSARVSRSF